MAGRWANHDVVSATPSQSAEKHFSGARCGSPKNSDAPVFCGSGFEQLQGAVRRSAVLYNKLKICVLGAQRFDGFPCRVESISAKPDGGYERGVRGGYRV